MNSMGESADSMSGADLGGARQFANPAYEPEGQTVDYERANGDSHFHFKEQAVNSKDLPHKVTFTERKLCSCRRMLIAVIVLAVVIGLAVAVYFLYENLSKKRTNTVSSSLRLVDEKYTIDLEDFRSSRYVTLSRDITVLLGNIFSQDSSIGKFYSRCAIQDFKAGSVKAEFLVIYNKEYEAPFLEDSVESILRHSIKPTPQGHMLGKFRVDNDIQARAVDSSLPPEPAESTSQKTTTPTVTSEPKAAISTTLEATPTPSPTTTTTLSRTTQSSTTQSSTTQSSTTQSSTTQSSTTQSSTTQSSTAQSSTTISTSTTTSTTTTPVPTQPPTTPPTCESIWITQCHDPVQVTHNTTTFPNLMGHASQEDASYGLSGLLNLLDRECHPFVRRFVCAVLVPECVPGDELRTLSPCRDLCSSVMTKCTRHLPQSFIDGVDCAALPSTDCVSAPPLQPPSLRLSDGAGPFEGRVEIQHAGSWGTICDDGFSEEDAQVICRQMGYRQGGTPRHQAYFTQGRGQIWLSSLECQGSERHLTECRHSEYGRHHCAHTEDAGVTCHTDAPEITIETRLVGGRQQHEGRVEVYYKGRWGPVCDDQFTQDAARTVCRSLGISDLSLSRMVSNTAFTPSENEPWLDDVGCDGMEISLALCEHSPWGVHNCMPDHSEDVAVSCLPIPTTTTSTTTSKPSTTTTTQRITTSSTTLRPTEPSLELRLTGRSSPLHGNVEVRHEGEWRGVCDDKFRQEEATVVCRMLGYEGDDISTASYPDGPTKLWLDEVDCVGDELSLANCDHDEWGKHDCSHIEAVGVSCGPEPTTTPTIPPTTTTPPLPNVTIQLVEGPDSHHGRVQLTYKGRMGTVCDDDFDMNDARVICRMVGYNGADITFGSELYTDGSGEVLLDDLDCNGEETTIAACQHRGWGVQNCGHTEDIGVNCGPVPTTTTSRSTTSSQATTVPMTAWTNATTVPVTEMRLNGGMDAAEGALQVNIQGIWTPVCTSHFLSTDTVAVCTRLGFIGFSPKLLRPTSPPSSQVQNTTLGVTCANVSACMPMQWSTSQCTVSTRVSLSCVPVRVRLADSTVAGEGRPEVFAGGSWGTICDDEFDKKDAQVLCRMLGYNGAAKKLNDNLAGPESLEILLDNLECSGEETSVFDCPHPGVGQANCNHYEDVAIKCLTIPDVPTPLKIRLVDGPHPMEGVLEVYHEGTWGSVCADDFQLHEAKVACKMLNGSGNVTVLRGGDTGDTDNLWLQDVSCTGREGSLADCGHAPWGDNSFCFDRAMISCGPSPLAPTTAATTTLLMTTPIISTTTMGPLATRLAGSSLDTQGRVEVFYNGTWGTVCSDQFGVKDAQVVCRSVGFNDTSQVAVLENTLPVLNTSIPILLDSVACTGSETNLVYCTHDGWGTHNCHHNEDVIVQCVLPDESHVTFRLVGGSRPGAGRLEVQYTGQWGTVCDDGFTDRSAEVACRQLGFNNTSEARHLVDGPFGSGSGLIWLNHVACSGAEASILDCPHDAWGQHNCEAEESVSIECQAQVTQTSTTTTQQQPIEARCEEINVVECRDILPYNYVMLPNTLGHQTQQDVVAALELNQWHHLFAECESPELAVYVCSLLLPDCQHDDGNGEGKQPCVSLCNRVERVCRPQLDDQWPPQWSCDGLPEKIPGEFPNICFDQPISGSGQCQPIQVPFCSHDLAYNRTQLPNTFQHQSQHKVQQAAAVWLGLSDTGCHPKLRSFVCSLYTPPCPLLPGLPVQSPCSTTCLEVQDACAPFLTTAWPQEVNCHNLPNPNIGQVCDMLEIQLPRTPPPSTTTASKTTGTILTAVMNTTVEATTASATNMTTLSTTPLDVSSTIREIPSVTPSTVANVTSATNGTTPLSSLSMESTRSTITMLPNVSGSDVSQSTPASPIVVTTLGLTTNATAVPVNVTVVPTNVTMAPVKIVPVNMTVVPEKTTSISVNITVPPDNTTVTPPSTVLSSIASTEPVLPVSTATVQTVPLNATTTPGNTTTAVNITAPSPSSTSPLVTAGIVLPVNITVVPLNASEVPYNGTDIPPFSFISTSVSSVNTTVLPTVNVTVLPANGTGLFSNASVVMASTVATSPMPVNVTLMPVNVTVVHVNVTQFAVNTTTLPVSSSSLPDTTTLPTINVSEVTVNATSYVNVTALPTSSLPSPKVSAGETKPTVAIVTTDSLVNLTAKYSLLPQPPTTSFPVSPNVTMQSIPTVNASTPFKMGNATVSSVDTAVTTETVTLSGNVSQISNASRTTLAGEFNRTEVPTTIIDGIITQPVLTTPTVTPASTKTTLPASMNTTSSAVSNITLGSEEKTVAPDNAIISSNWSRSTYPDRMLTTNQTALPLRTTEAPIITSPLSITRSAETTPVIVTDSNATQTPIAEQRNATLSFIPVNISLPLSSSMMPSQTTFPSASATPGTSSRSIDQNLTGTPNISHVSDSTHISFEPTYSLPELMNVSSTVGPPPAGNASGTLSTEITPTNRSSLIPSSVSSSGPTTGVISITTPSAGTGPAVNTSTVTPSTPSIMYTSQQAVTPSVANETSTMLSTSVLSTHSIGANITALVPAANTTVPGNTTTTVRGLETSPSVITSSTIMKSTTPTAGSPSAMSNATMALSSTGAISVNTTVSPLPSIDVTTADKTTPLTTKVSTSSAAQDNATVIITPSTVAGSTTGNATATQTTETVKTETNVTTAVPTATMSTLKNTTATTRPTVGSAIPIGNISTIPPSVSAATTTGTTTVMALSTGPSESRTPIPEAVTPTAATLSSAETVQMTSNVSSTPAMPTDSAISSNQTLLTSETKVPKPSQTTIVLPATETTIITPVTNGTKATLSESTLMSSTVSVNQTSAHTPSQRFTSESTAAVTPLSTIPSTEIITTLPSQPASTDQRIPITTNGTVASSAARTTQAVVSMMVATQSTVAVKVNITHAVTSSVETSATTIAPLSEKTSTLMQILTTSAGTVRIVNTTSAELSTRTSTISSTAESSTPTQSVSPTTTTLSPTIASTTIVKSSTAESSTPTQSVSPTTTTLSPTIASTTIVKSSTAESSTLTQSVSPTTTTLPPTIASTTIVKTAPTTTTMAATESTITTTAADTAKSTTVTTTIPSTIELTTPTVIVPISTTVSSTAESIMTTTAAPTEVTLPSTAKSTITMAPTVKVDTPAVTSTTTLPSTSEPSTTTTIKETTSTTQTVELTTKTTLPKSSSTASSTTELTTTKLPTTTTSVPSTGATSITTTIPSTAESTTKTTTTPTTTSSATITLTSSADTSSTTIPSSIIVSSTTPQSITELPQSPPLRTTQTTTGITTSIIPSIVPPVETKTAIANATTEPPTPTRTQSTTPEPTSIPVDKVSVTLLPESTSQSKPAVSPTELLTSQTLVGMSSSSPASQVPTSSSTSTEAASTSTSTPLSAGTTMLIPVSSSTTEMAESSTTPSTTTSTAAASTPTVSSGTTSSQIDSLVSQKSLPTDASTPSTSEASTSKATTEAPTLSTSKPTPATSPTIMAPSVSSSSAKTTTPEHSTLLSSPTITVTKQSVTTSSLLSNITESVMKTTKSISASPLEPTTLAMATQETITSSVGTPTVKNITAAGNATTSTGPTPTTGTVQCEAMTVGLLSECSDHVNYTQVGFPNFFEQSSQIDVHTMLIPFIGHAEDKCDLKLKPFICRLYLPPCDDSTGTLLQPCASLCETVKDGCDANTFVSPLGVGLPIDCTKLPTENCYNGITNLSCDENEPGGSAPLVGCVWRTVAMRSL